MIENDRTLRTGNKQSKLGCLRKGVPKRSVLAHFFFNLNTYISNTYIIFGFHSLQKSSPIRTIMHCYTFRETGRTLNQDIHTLSPFL